jgi:hypothetical protein
VVDRSGFGIEGSNDVQMKGDDVQMKGDDVRRLLRPGL